MHGHLIAALIAAPAPDSGTSGPSFLNSAGIQALLVFVASVVLMIVGTKLFMKSDKGDVKGAANTGVVVVIASIVFSAGIAGSWYAIGSGALSSLTGG